MIEYIYNIIKASAGEQIIINAEITDNEDKPITTGCSLMVLDGDSVLANVEGTYQDYWTFTVPAIERAGKYQYVIKDNDASIMFSQPLYIV